MFSQNHRQFLWRIRCTNGVSPMRHYLAGGIIEKFSCDDCRLTSPPVPRSTYIYVFRFRRRNSDRLDEEAVKNDEGGIPVNNLDKAIVDKVEAGTIVKFPTIDLQFFPDHILNLGLGNSTYCAFCIVIV